MLAANVLAGIKRLHVEGSVSKSMEISRHKTWRVSTSDSATFFEQNCIFSRPASEIPQPLSRAQ